MRLNSEGLFLIEDHSLFEGIIGLRIDQYVINVFDHFVDAVGTLLALLNLIVAFIASSL